MAGLTVSGANAPIERDRVVRRLADASQHAVTALLAPAGYGKSIALQQYLTTLGVPYLRYDVRAENSSLLGFARGFAEIAHGVSPGASGTVADAVQSALTSEAPGASLALWLGEHLLAFEGAIAVDDLHNADADPRCAEFLVALIERTKRRVRWIIASRSARALPLSTWLVYGDAAVPVVEDDLRFTVDEARLAARQGRSRLDDADVERLLETTAGWATAFTLALRLAEYSGDVAGAAAQARQLSYEYLAEHVYRSLSDEERALLAVGSLLPELDVEVLEKAGFERAAVQLDELMRRATFLTAAPSLAGAQARRYRCHSLFRDFLENSLELEGDQKRAATHLRAARALQACGYIIPALGLFVRAHAHRETLDLLETHGFDLAERAHGDAVLAAIDSLPEADRTGRPAIVGLRAHFERAGGRYERSQMLYERALALSPSADLSAMLAAKLAGALFNQGKNPAELLEPLAVDPAISRDQRGELLSLLGLCQARFGQHAGLAPLFDQIEALAAEVDSDVTRAQMLHQLGTAALLYGDAERSDRTLERALELAEANGMYKLASVIYTSIGSNAASNEDDLPKAAHAARMAGETAAKSGELFLSRWAYARQLDIGVHRGDAERLAELIRACEALPGPEHAQLGMALAWARAMLAAWEGHFDEAARQQMAVCGRESFQEERMLMDACCSLFLVAAGRREEALEYANTSTREGKRRSSMRRSYERNREFARALCALTEAFAGRATAARRLLQKKALVDTPVTNAMLGAAALVIRDLDAGVSLDALAPYFATLHAHWYGGFARTIAAVLRAYKRENDQAIKLTPTELGVLRSLADGRTPKEIALDAGCSIHTVRWHIRQAVSKFGCSGREQAIRAAHARGLL